MPDEQEKTFPAHDSGGMLGCVAVVVWTLICTDVTMLVFGCCLGWVMPLFTSGIAMFTGSAIWIAVAIFWGRVN